jgi:hypothetical protein
MAHYKTLTGHPRQGSQNVLYPSRVAVIVDVDVVARQVFPTTLLVSFIRILRGDIRTFWSCARIFEFYMSDLSLTRSISASFKSCFG